MHLIVTEVEEETEDGLEIENDIDDKLNTLSLYLRWYDDAEEIEEAVQREVLRSAKEESKTKIREDTTAYRIGVLKPDDAWFQPVVRKNLKSRPLETNYREKGEIIVVFEGIKPADAEELVKDLEKPKSPVRLPPALQGALDPSLQVL